MKHPISKDWNMCTVSLAAEVNGNLICYNNNNGYFYEA